MTDNSIIEFDAAQILKTIDLSVIDNKSILITGASGLVGTYLLFVLREYNHNGGKLKSVTAIHKGSIPSHLIELANSKMIKFIAGDLTSQEFLNELNQFDIIIHAAGYGQPQKFMGDPMNTIRLNAFTTDILLSKVKKNGKFVFLSSSELYIGSGNTPNKVSDIGNSTPSHPRAPYIEGKRIGETISMQGIKLGLEVKIVRLSLLYGPGFRRDDSRVLNQFISMASKGDIHLLDDGNVSRTYCYISDGIEMILKIMTNGKEILYNVGGHSKTTILELAKEISGFYSSKVIESINKNKLSAPDSVELDMSLTEFEFDKKNYVDFKEGLSRTIRWFERNINEKQTFD